MNRPLRHVAFFVALLFVVLAGSTTYYQVIAADQLNADPRNRRTVLDEFGRDRGPIVVKGEAVAESQKSGDAYGYLRKYPQGKLYSAATGFYSVTYGFSGIERAENDTLSGSSDALFYQRVSSILSGSAPEGASVSLTLDPAVKKGAAVALDPTTGKILGLVTSPSYDPNALSSHDPAAVQKAWKAMGSDPDRPLTNRAIGGNLYPPGSTFKLIVAAAALEAGGYTKDSSVAGPGTYKLPLSSSVMNNHAGGGTAPCGPNDASTLQQALEQSCNTTFAILGGKLGASSLQTTASEFGFGAKLAIPQSVTPSTMGTDLNAPQLAMASIGQYEDKVTPLQMAMVAAGIDNDGAVMQPQLIDSVRTSTLKELRAFSAKKLGQPLSAANAAQMRQMMQGVVTNGTGTSAQIPGAEVGGKTGTAEWASGKPPHAWFVGYANKGSKKIAVAVVVEQGGYGGDAAAPIARTMMEAGIGR